MKVLQPAKFANRADMLNLHRPPGSSPSFKKPRDNEGETKINEVMKQILLIISETGV